MSKIRTCPFFEKFKKGRQRILSEAGSKNKKQICSPGSFAIAWPQVEEDITATTHLNYGAVYRILHEDLEMSKRAAKRTLHLLVDEHKRKKVDVAFTF